MTIVRRILALSALAAALASGAVLAHDTGHESRTKDQCEKLPGTDKTGERAQCLACVTRPVKHHFHPDYPAGQRCRPDDGKP